MFTGIVETMAKVLSNVNGTLVVDRPKSFDDIRIGSSVCIAGVCLTVVELNKTTMSFEMVSETLQRTTLGEKIKGDRVNLERALKADGRFEGHVVQGHSETVGEVLKLSKGGLLSIDLPKELHSFVVEKGSIAIDGVSLTIARLKKHECTIALIPHTLKITTLGLLNEGDQVNIETDILGRYIRQC